jgi:NitT/TauT family transport system substrate-binding protein
MNANHAHTKTSGKMNDHNDHWSRREFLAKLGLAGSAALLGLQSDVFAAEPPPETTKLRLARVPSICTAPLYIGEELLRGEGFTDVQYVDSIGGLPTAKAMSAGQIDISMNFAAPITVSLDAEDSIVVLAGVHVGCFELFGTERVRRVHDLKGKTVAVLGMGSAQHIFVSSMAAHVGLDPRRDINFVTHPVAEAKRLLAEGKIDAYMGFPPDPQELRAKKIGHVVVNSAVDRPRSQYFCCMVVANRDFARKNPVATKRILRAILKGDEVCALDPARAARSYVDKGYPTRYEDALQAMKEIPYGKWREYDPEDTLRYYALRLHEAGMIKNNPQKILAQGTDWRFLKELKKELKA